jgi:uncharacterized protein YkwD
MDAAYKYGMKPVPGRKGFMSSLTIYLAMLMLGSNFSSTVAKEPPKPVIQQPAQSVLLSDAVQMTDEEQRFVDLLNRERMQRGLRTLTIDSTLIEVARGHSKEMAEKNYFDHVSPTPGLRTALDRYLASIKRRPTWALVGENLFYCSIVDVNRGHTCFMESRSHKENILNPKFDRIGVGVYKDEDGEFWVTEMFLAQID